MKISFGRKILRLLVTLILIYVTLLVIGTLLSIALINMDEYISADERYLFHNQICNSDDIIVHATASVTNDFLQILMFLVACFFCGTSVWYIYIRVKVNYNKIIKRWKKRRGNNNYRR